MLKMLKVRQQTESARPRIELTLKRECERAYGITSGDWDKRIPFLCATIIAVASALPAIAPADCSGQIETARKLLTEHKPREAQAVALEAT